MTTATLLTIGQLATAAGLPVRTIRFYSDSGVIPPAGRSEAGYRLYGPDAPARLGLARTLRELGFDLVTVRRVLEREINVPDIAAAHAAALEAQIRVLRMQKAVLLAVARRQSDPKEMQRMSKLAHLSQAERRRVVTDFLDEAFEGLDIEPGFADRMRSATPELPDEPTGEQIDAWIELAELVQDPAFRRSIRRMSEQHAASRKANGGAAQNPDWGAAAALVAEKGESARVAGVAPGTAEAADVLNEIVPAFAGPDDDARDPSWREQLADRLATGTDVRAERYWQLLAVINGWPPVPTTMPAWEWLIAALRASR